MSFDRPVEQDPPVVARPNLLSGAWDETARLYWQGLPLLARIAGVAAALQVASLAYSGRALVAVPLAIAAVISGFLVPPALVWSAGNLHRGEPMGLVRAYRQALRRVLPFVVATVLLWLLVFVVAIVPVMVVAASHAGALTLLAVLLACVFLVTLRYQLYLPAIVSGHEGPVAGLSWSKRHLKGRLIRFLPFAFVQALTEAAPTTLGGAVSGWSGLVGTFLVGTFVLPWGPVGLAVVYDRLLKAPSVMQTGDLEDWPR